MAEEADITPLATEEAVTTGTVAPEAMAVAVATIGAAAAVAPISMAAAAAITADMEMRGDLAIIMTAAMPVPAEAERAHAWPGWLWCGRSPAESRSRDHSRFG